MPDVKKIIKNAVEGGLEAAKDSAKQIAETVSPGALIEQALGSKSSNSEVTDYLKNLGDPNLSGDKLAQREAEMKNKDEEVIAETKRRLFGIPEHMKLPAKPRTLTPYEMTVREEEEKKARMVEAQKKQQQQSMAQPTSKPKRGSLFARKKAAGKGFEGLAKDAKAG